MTAMRLLTVTFSTIFFCFTIVQGQPTTSRDTTETKQKPTDVQDIPPASVIKTNPLATIWGQIPFTGELRVMFERRFTTKQSIYGSVGYITPSLLVNFERYSGGELNVRGVRVQVGYKYYLTDHYAPKGFYISPHFSYNTAKAVIKDAPQNYVQATFINGSVLLGYQVISNGRFAFDIFTGLGVKSNTWTVASADSIVSASSLIDPESQNINIKPSFGFNFGLAF